MYKLHGALASPYSMKMRAVLRYRRIPHVWSQGASARAAAAAAKTPVIPVLEYPDGHFAYDSTPLIHDLEARHAERSVIPDNPVHAFVAHLIEDFADEWLTKAMFGYRWLEAVDQEQMCVWLAFDMLQGGGLAQIEGTATPFRARQVGRMALVGCTRENFPLIATSNRRVLAALEAHVVDRHWLFGTRPSLAEFAIFGQISQLGVDPTPQAMMRAEFPYTYRWLGHVDDASGVEGAWDDEGLSPAADALLAEAGRIYAPFLLANAAAMAEGQGSFRIEVDGLPYEQGTFGYQVKCLDALRRRHQTLPDSVRGEVDALLARHNLMVLFA